MANPTLLKTPIASGGDKNTIPETTGSTTGLLSQEKGWQQINSLPINAGGIAPSRLDFNGVFNLLSNILFYTQKGWQWEFDETQNYFAGCTVKDTADGKTYVCIADVNASTTHPNADTTHWKLSDLATKDDLANYLPLAGGQMTGSGIRKNVTTSSLEIVGSTSSGAGAWLELFGKDHSSYPWTFMMQAGSTSESRLIGKSDGTLTWGGAKVLTDANGGYLPLSGGNLHDGGEVHIGIDSNTNGLVLRGGPDEHNGQIVLYGREYYGTASQGGFDIIANKDSATPNITLTGRPNGDLAWNNNDLGGSAIVAKSLGTTGYSKRADGLIMQWGTVTNLPASQSVVPVTFPITFPNGVGPVIITSAGNYGNQRGFSWGQVKDITTSGFNLSEASSDVDSQGKNWFAIGY